MQQIYFMSNAISIVPHPVNEPVLSYAPGTKEREAVLAAYKEFCNSTTDIPMYIGGKEIRTEDVRNVISPQDKNHRFANYYYGTEEHVEMAIASALQAKSKWAAMPWEQRCAIFLKAAELFAGPYRAKINAATMVGQSKNVHQAEIDSACELIDFLRFNAHFAAEIYKEQPVSDDAIWNRVEYRPLEGFCFAVTPFNFTAISGNLPASMALMGNTVVWKPSDKQTLSAKVIMDVFQEAGLPDGVINMIFTDGKKTAEQVMSHKDFAGLHFTGSTDVFRNMWSLIGQNINTYKTYPRIVGETGGKDFVLAHNSADPSQVATGLVRGAFEYQGQKCSAASRGYIPRSIWEQVKTEMKRQLEEIKVGSPEDPQNFVNAVIDQGAFDRCKSYIDLAKNDPDAEILFGGKYDDSVGFFVHPTVILTKNPNFKSMWEEIFGPILTLYVYDDEEWKNTLQLIDNTSIYALTGAIFSRCRYATVEASKALENAAGNFYINDKPTGAVVGQQPFGGARASGTNDKAGSKMNLLRWVSVRTIKETFLSPKDYKYPFLG